VRVRLVNTSSLYLQFRQQAKCTLSHWGNTPKGFTQTVEGIIDKPANRLKAEALDLLQILLSIGLIFKLIYQKLLG